MTTKRLSQTQLDALEYAASKPETDRRRINNENGWFYAQSTTQGSIDFFCAPHTLASLRRRGLLEWRVSYHTSRKGKTVEFWEYRINEPGRDYLKSL
jgi:hypothetical protein